MLRSVDFVRGLAVGVGLMYLFDPERGGARRALLRDRLARSMRDGRDFLDDAVHDLRNRARGAAARSASHLHSDVTDDHTLSERVRAKLGRYVSHPRALIVDARSGSVTLNGPILRREVEPLIGAVSSVRGVREVLNRLEPHDSGDPVPELQGPGRRTGVRRGYELTPGLQLVAGVLGITAVAFGARRVATRVQSARADALEREMPEYAMLR